MFALQVVIYNQSDYSIMLQIGKPQQAESSKSEELLSRRMTLVTSSEQNLSDDEELIEGNRIHNLTSNLRFSSCQF